MPKPTAEDYEGRLAAQRAILITLVDTLLQAGLLSATGLEQDLVVRDGQEDPGVLPEQGFAFENARAEEMRAIIGRAIERFEARTKIDGAAG